MSISFKRLCNYFSEKIESIYFINETDISFRDIKIITDNHNLLKGNFIYIGKTSMLHDDYKNINNVNLILINDNNINISNFFINKLNIMEIKKSTNIFELYDEIRDFFIQEAELEYYKVTLLKALITNNGLEYIIKAASKILGNPLIVIDLGYKVLAYSSEIEITDSLWCENIKKGYCSYDFVIAVKKIKCVQHGLKSDEPYEVACKNNDILKLVSKIKTGSNHIGNIILFEQNRKILPKDKEILMIVSEIVAEEMKKNSFYNNIGNVAYEDFICDLLENNINDSKIIEDRMKIGNIKIGKELYVCVFDISQYNSYGHPLDYLNHNFHSLLSYHNPVYYKNNIVVIHDNEKLRINSLFIKKVKDFLSHNRIYLGISREFSSIENCKKHYLQSIRAIELGQILDSKKHITLYEDIQLYDLVSLKNNYIDYTDYYHPSLIILIEYDKKNNSDLYNTLFVYLKNNQNIKRTSEELFIHRNTVSYKIQKIQNLTNVDFSDVENIFKIYTSYKIINYLNKIKEKT